MIGEDTVAPREEKSPIVEDVSLTENKNSTGDDAWDWAADGGKLAGDWAADVEN